MTSADETAELAKAFPPHPIDPTTAFAEWDVTHVDANAFEEGVRGRRWTELAAAFLEHHHDALVFFGPTSMHPSGLTRNIENVNSKMNDLEKEKDDLEYKRNQSSDENERKDYEKPFTCRLHLAVRRIGAVLLGQVQAGEALRGSHPLLRSAVDPGLKHDVITKPRSKD